VHFAGFVARDRKRAKATAIINRLAGVRCIYDSAYCVARG
jgi:uncharacterized membrane protein YcgQ (UPF0703/DUF1980 family)